MSPAKAAALVLLLATLAVVALSALTRAPLMERVSLSAAPERTRYSGDPFTVPADVAAPLVATVATLEVKPAASPIRPASLKVSPPTSAEVRDLADRQLLIPVVGIPRSKLRDNFDEMRGSKRRHDALDIMAPRGTRVVAVEDGRVAKLFTSAAGGLTVYQFDPQDQFAYYYAHLDRYAEGLAEGTILKRGDLVGYVGSTGNAPASAPHLHFTIFRLGPDKRWWKGAAVNPYPYLKSEAR